MYKAIVIGGSAGSFQVVTKILSSLPKTLSIPVLLSMHRLKHVRSGFLEALELKSNLPIIEPNDKEQIKAGRAYLAPANYHMYIELGNRIALSTEEPMHHSRPSIDLSFMTAAQAYREKLIGIILSGANSDGALGLQKVKEYNGVTIVQDPDECQVRTMSEAAIKQTKIDYIFTTDQIIKFLLKIS
jgi:two-component system, chemotaxis family, protein-glutamate methylesterase/glutaminase